MIPIWLRGISESDLDYGRSVMRTNMVAGDTLAIKGWRYNPLGCVLYAVLRSAVYCLRHWRSRGPLTADPASPIYLYFTPTCEIGVRELERAFPGDAIGFKGRNGYNYPLWKLLCATVLCFRSPALWRWIRADRRWRPWISDVLFYILTRRWAAKRFAAGPPRVFIYSNDHCCFDRGIVDAAAASGHTTVYVQHAAVTDIFPPLSAHYSLLDGDRALRVYKAIPGSRGTALVCGRQYALTALQKTRRPARTALVCTSTIDTVESWKPVLQTLRTAQYRVLLRTHPSDRQLPSWIRMAEEVGAQWLDPRENSLAQALAQSGIVFAGQSGVLLEAALSGAVPVLVQFDEDTERGLYDYFGFGASKLAYLARPGDIGAVLDKVDSGQAIVSPDAIKSFDIAFSSERNQQIVAVEAILSKGDDRRTLEQSGFVLLPALSGDGLDVFFPSGYQAAAD